MPLLPPDKTTGTRRQTQGMLRTPGNRNRTHHHLRRRQTPMMPNNKPETTGRHEDTKQQELKKDELSVTLYRTTPSL